MDMSIIAALAAAAATAATFHVTVAFASARVSVRKSVWQTTTTHFRSVEPRDECWNGRRVNGVSERQAVGVDLIWPVSERQESAWI